MKKDSLHILVVLYLALSGTTLLAQESVFKALKSDLKKANEFYKANAYHDAVQLYTRLTDQKKGNNVLHLKIANSYFMLNKMEPAVSSYSKYAQDGGKFNETEIVRFATSLQATGDYDRAIAWFQKYTQKNPKDHEISLRIWQLQNIKYLYEDSIFYSVVRLPNNTRSDEICPNIYENSIVFASNRETVQTFNRIDANNKPFYSWYISKVTTKIDAEKVREYAVSEPFGSSIHAKYHKGSIAFYPGGDTMVFVRTIHQPNKNRESTTQIFFAKKEGKLWKECEAFPFNSNQYSVNHPALSEDGYTIYFTSDMPGGYGGMDIYRTDIVNGRWSDPQNMGNIINTKQDEKYPFIQNGTLYFSSNGQPGFGGLDIFMVILEEYPFEVINLGYPINTYFDDFSLVLDGTMSFGYFVSNRNTEIINDDIFEVHISKPSYPITVSGKIKYKITNLKDSTIEMKQLDYAKLELIDKLKRSKVQEAHSDAEGNFTIEIPYEGQFMLGVTKKGFGVAVVAMNIPRNPKDYLNHDIVIVKDLFNNQQDKENNLLNSPNDMKLLNNKEL